MTWLFWAEVVSFFEPLFSQREHNFGAGPGKISAHIRNVRIVLSKDGEFGAFEKIDDGSAS